MYALSDLPEVFTYHAPDAAQMVDYGEIRAAAQQFAKVLLLHTPTCPDQTVAIRKVREAVMIANAAVALKGKF